MTRCRMLARITKLPVEVLLDNWRWEPDFYQYWRYRLMEPRGAFFSYEKL